MQKKPDCMRPLTLTVRIWRSVHLSSANLPMLSRCKSPKCRRYRAHSRVLAAAVKRHTHGQRGHRRPGRIRSPWPLHHRTVFERPQPLRNADRDPRIALRCTIFRLRAGATPHDGKRRTKHSGASWQPSAATTGSGRTCTGSSIPGDPATGPAPWVVNGPAAGYTARATRASGQSGFFQ